MNQIDLLFFLLIVTLASLVQADSLRPVYKHGCVALQNQKIYCYGGAFRNNNTQNRVDTYFDDDQLYDHHMYLDVSKPLNVSSANTQWQAVPWPSGTPFQLEARADFGITAYSPNAFIISGGIGPTLDAVANNHSLTNISTFYDAETNIWTTLLRGVDNSGETIGNTFDSQTFGQRATQVTDNDYVIFGGVPPNNNTILRWNTTFVYNVKKSANSSEIVAYTLPLIRGHSVSSDPSRRYRGVPATDINSQVVLFGGLMPQNASDNHNYKDFVKYIDFSTVIVFYPQRQTFEEVKTASPNDFPAYRELHTVTTIPRINKMILYGGVNELGAVHDFCWLYDASKRMWETVKFTNGNGPGRLFGHQAVMVGSDMLYIIGGIDALGVTQKDVHILNVTSMTWLNGSYTNTYDQRMDGEANNNGSDTATVSLGAGAIAGIVIGCVAGVAILVAAAVILCLQRRKKATMVPSDAPDGFASTASSQPFSSSPNEYNRTKPDAPAPPTISQISSSVKPSAG